MTDTRQALARAVDCLEILNKRPRPMCRDCADSDGVCPNSGLDCDMRALIRDARAALQAQAAPAPEPSACGLTECKNKTKCDRCKAWDSMGI